MNIGPATYWRLTMGRPQDDTSIFLPQVRDIVVLGLETVL